ncbi:hypothetical protein IC762_18875 [Bradyrhizobium genosp. L]|uniref:hypothetical protein n=1 Tax=Bradyrhizobium genosp. L TaxID=83637 RepID=UPI0018A2BFF7|nr:hypothetical protein [Bradyrhizobium genosp. L]QPF81867.1 hypothetical protein IC762_18875 [Bradyrhizobium genosp. L]
MFDQMKKRDWAFVAVCAAGALLFGVWSVRMGIAFHRSHQGVTELSSSQRHRAGASAEGAATREADDSDTQTEQPR